MNDTENRFDKAKRIGALAGVILLVCMVLMTFIFAFLRFEGSKQIFQGLIMLDICVPILLWGYLCILRWAKGRDERMQKKAEEILMESEEQM